MQDHPRSRSLALAAPAESRIEGLLQHGEFLQRMVQGLLCDPHDSDDVVQQTWLAVLTTPSDQVRKPRTWLAKIARNRSIDLIRRRRVRRSREEDSYEPSNAPPPEEVVGDEGVRDRLARAVAELSEPYRTSIELRFFEGLPPREVARRMGVPVETARTRIKRALHTLRLRLDGEFEGGRAAWMRALLPYAAPRRRALRPVGWKTLGVAAGLAALLLSGGSTFTGAGGADGARAAGGEEVVLSAPTSPEAGAGASDEESALGREDRWNTWPPVPAVEVESVFRRPRGFDHPLDGTTWASREAGRPARAPRVAERGSASGRVVDEPRRESAAPLLAASFGGVAASVDGASPLSVAPEDRVVPEAVWIVDPFGGGDFEDLETAAASASTGDALVLLPNPDGYEGLRLRGKGLALLGRGEERVEVRGLDLADLAPRQNVLARNVRFVASGDGPAVLLRDVRGSVWLEDCAVESRSGDGLSVESCSAVTVLRSEVSAGVQPADAPPAAGLRAVASEVSSHESVFRGPSGASPGPDSTGGGEGGLGALVLQGRLYASRTSFLGGAGGDSSHAVLARGGDGGAGLWVEGEARTLECSFEGGAGGEGPGGVGLPGPPRLGELEQLDAVPRSYELSAEAVGGIALLRAVGAPGDVLISIVSPAPSKGYLVLHQGTRLVAPPYDFVLEGVVPPNGVLERTIRVPTLLAMGGAYELFYAQGFFFDHCARAFLSSASSIFLFR